MVDTFRRRGRILNRLSNFDNTWSIPEAYQALYKAEEVELKNFFFTHDNIISEASVFHRNFDRTRPSSLKVI